MKRTITIDGKQTSITIEPQFLEAMKDICAVEEIKIPTFVKIARDSPSLTESTNLSNRIRILVLQWYQQQLEEWMESIRFEGYNAELSPLFTRKKEKEND